MLAHVESIITALLAGAWKYPAIFVAGLIEGTPIIGSAFPGGTISLVIGTYVHTGVFNAWVAMILLILGNFIGDMIGYGLGRAGHKLPIVRRTIEKESFGSAWTVFEQKLFYFVVLGRLLPVVRSVPSLLAGARQIPIQRYVGYSFAGSALWGAAGIWGGVVTEAIVGPHAWLLIVIVVVASVVWGYIKKVHKK